MAPLILCPPADTRSPLHSRAGHGQNKYQTHAKSPSTHGVPWVGTEMQAERTPAAGCSLRCLVAFVLQGCAILSALESGAHAESPALDFNRDIRPILAENCFYCHGQDANKRQAELRLDVRDAAIEAGAIVPKDPRSSELVSRINATDPKELMPPPKSNRRLTPEQKKRLERWIEEGANYATHWAFVAPERPADARREGHSVGAEPHRPVRAREARSRRDVTFARGRPGHPHQAALGRPDGAASDARGGRCLHRRHRPEGVRKARRPPARQPALRRADGPAMARRRPLRRQQRVPAGRRHLAMGLARLAGQGAERRHAFRSVHHPPPGRRPPARGHDRGQDRQRIQPQSPPERGRRRDRRGTAVREPVRPDRHHRHHLARPDDGVRPVSRSQI